MIELKDITVKFNKDTHLEHVALDSLNLKIHEQEFVVIIGGNGAGKSTLMNVLCGNIIPDSGKILIDNKDVTRQSPAQRAELISRVFQDPMVGTCDELTIEENFALFNKRGSSRWFAPALQRKQLNKFINIVKNLGLPLADRMKEKMGMLSGGQRQVLSLVMSTLAPAKLLLLDEHTAALDPKMAKFVLEFTNKIVKQNKLTTLMVTHNMKQALEEGERLIVMNKGKIIEDLDGKQKRDFDPNKLWEEINC